jgi:polyferredoxin
MTEFSEPSSVARLRAVKIVHTVVWAFFAACILAIPVASSLGHFRMAAWLAGIVFVEVIVLLANSWACPLTAVAARYTTDRNANFDIYLPEWLARNNKTVFGWLYVVGAIVAAIQYTHA